MKKLISGSIIALLIMTAVPASAEKGGTITRQAPDKNATIDTLFTTVLETFTWNSSVGKITFVDGRYVADAGCNKISGTFNLQGTSVSLGTPVSTMMFCEGKMKDEAALTSLLDSATTLTFKNGGFNLSNGSTTTYFAATFATN